ncbi:GLPGLI family protein [Chryseobacterium indoltheticum]|uniref:GLPGLI family protein n=1 Tax=Chryseobacterium indoltheticum TaxID=254 RepID=A0A381FK50_9FLAO|nr:GLPGLI family protein [Chryseobacterium indoltheticum]SUX46532.1 GLPGLI family protein [Chryseobacterium indoltheticum]
MNFIKKNILSLIFLFFISISYSQNYAGDSLRGNFTYLLQSKPNKLDQDFVYKELFSLQISDQHAFFMSEKLLEYDSVFAKEFNTSITKSGGDNIIDFRGKSFPKIQSDFVIIQTNDIIKYYSYVGISVLHYNTPVIKNWKLVNETQIINTLKCKKAEVNFKGRDWVAWYATEIPFPHGPFKFSGLPGLIVKISDNTGDYSFELIKSTSNFVMKGKIIKINKSRYVNSTLVTKQELKKANEVFRENLINSSESMGVVLTPEQKENLHQRKKQSEIEKKKYNPLELED